MSQAKVAALVEESKIQSNNCLYTAAALHIWLKAARALRQVFVIAPIVIGALASVFLAMEDNNDVIRFVASTLTILAGVFPAIFVALNLNMHVASISRSATEFTNLRDRFSQAAKLHADSEYDEFRDIFEVLMDRMDSARENSPALPEWCFKAAQDKINKGDYSHS